MILDYFFPREKKNEPPIDPTLIIRILVLALVIVSILGGYFHARLGIAEKQLKEYQLAETQP